MEAPPSLVCELCGDRLQADEAGYVCQHVAHSPAVTFVSAAAESGIPDTSCTGCDAFLDDFDDQDDPAITERLGLHIVCAECYSVLERTRIRATGRDHERGWALANRLQLSALRDCAWPHAPRVSLGDYAKLTFSRVPSEHPRYAESMWVQVTHREGEHLAGLLDNEPAVIETLTCGDRVEFVAANVVDACASAPLQPRPDSHTCELCDAALRSKRESLDESEHRLLSDVSKFGWDVVLIEEDDEGPAFAFTVGLFHSFEHAEIALFGLDTRMMGELLNRVGALVRDGHRFTSGESVPLLEQHSCRFASIDVEHYREYLGFANWFHRGTVYPALQLIWPDEADRFPWQTGFEPSLSDRQPLLMHPPTSPTP